MSNDEDQPVGRPLGHFSATQLSADDHYSATPLEQSGDADKAVKGLTQDNTDSDNHATLVGSGPLAKVQSEKHGSRIVISFKPTDPDHPHNWPRRRKLLVFFAGIASVINSTLGSSLPSGAIEPIAQHFGIHNEFQLVLPISCFLMGYIIGPILCGPLSEHLGRHMVMAVAFVIYTLFTMACAVAPTWASFLFFRLICGITASAPIAIVGGLYADIYGNPQSRGFAMAVFMAATSCGPVLAPLLSGFIGQSTSWRWVFGAGTFIALATLPFLIMTPESYLPVLLSRKAARLRKETGNENIIAATDLQKKSFKYVMTVVMTRPYRMLFQEAIVACVCLYATLVYAIYYLYFEAYPIIFQGQESVYKFSPGITGLAFLPIALGSILCAPVFLAWDAHLRKARAQNAAWVKKEEYRRLPLACIGGPLYTIAIFWLGWSSKADVNYMAPIMSGVLFGIGYLLIFMALLNYVSDAYLTFAASAQGIASTCRSIGGAVLPFASRRLFNNLGISWACTLLAFLNLGVAIIPFVFIRYGERIRRNSKFCQELRRMQEEEEKQREAESQENSHEKDAEAGHRGHFGGFSSGLT